MKLTTQQQEAFYAIKRFLMDRQSHIFILRGYAGTGKTTMIKSIVHEVVNSGKRVVLMAPTGRAAKVLREKTGAEVYTIHKSIYSTDKLKPKRHDKNGELIGKNSSGETTTEKDNSVDQLHFYFSIYEGPFYNPYESVIIVDEASMISSVASKSEFLHFGTDVLLDDLLTFAQPHRGAKIIFVGDPAQLPPVGDNKSAALDQTYFIDKGLKVASYELTDIIRQSGESAILKNAMMIRDLLRSDHRTSYVFACREGEVEQIGQNEVVNKFIESQPTPDIGDSIIICYSNSQVKEYNDQIRGIYFPGNQRILTGEILQVVKNNYDQEFTLFNGDFVKVIEVDDNVETHTAPVWVSRNGVRKRENISVSYRKVTLLTAEGYSITRLIIEDLLNSPFGSLSVEKNTSMYIDFVIRHGDIRGDVDRFTSELMKDPYFNALHVKYGYAITGHKSQGGEWHTAFVDYTKRTGADDDSLRWSYTATTRASQRLFCVNMPHITPLSKFKISDIVRASKPQPGAINLADVNCPYIPDAQPFQKAKCNSAEIALSSINCKIIEVAPLAYRDRYTIATPEGIVTADCVYNSSGVYTSITVRPTNSYNDDVVNALNQNIDYKYLIDYSPRFDALRLLHNKVISVCDELGITITNIVEKGYTVTYYFITSGKYSYLQCYFNNAGFVTTAVPGSDLGTDDQLLNLLIYRLTITE